MPRVVAGEEELIGSFRGWRQKNPLGRTKEVSAQFRRGGALTAFHDRRE
jgi:hypothetical protein